MDVWCACMSGVHVCMHKRERTPLPGAERSWGQAPSRDLLKNRHTEIAYGHFWTEAEL